MNEEKSFPLLLEALLLLLIFFLFLTLGSDVYEQTLVRYGMGGVLLIFFLLARGVSLKTAVTGRLTLLVFGFFVFYEILRAVWGWCHPSFAWSKAYEVFYLRYRLSPLRWIFFLILIFLCREAFTTRRSVNRLFPLLAWSGFLLAVSCIPPLFHNGRPLYHSLDPARSGFFPPFVYFKSWVAKYFAGRVAHVNYTGDVIAVGLFAALGLTVYKFELFKEEVRELKSRSIDKMPWRSASIFLLPLTIAFVTASAILLLFSRGTMATMFIMFFVFLILLLIRLRSRNEIKFIAGIVFLMVVFTMWSGNLHKAWFEVQTLSKETDPSEGGSFATNREGARRAVGMYFDYPIWGVGTNGYKEISHRYITEPVPPGSFDFAKFQSMCHYLHVLAEEGAGAYLYFLFLVLYAWEVVCRLPQVKSRFQFIMAASLFSVVVMIFLHAGFNHLLERISTSALVSACMGASLGILREDFRADRG